MTPCKHWVTFEPGKVTPVVMTGDGRCPICRIEELERELAQLRAELEQAESRLREAQAALVYCAFMGHKTEKHMLPEGVSLRDNDWTVITFPDGTKVDTGRQPKALEAMRAVYAARVAEGEEK